MGFGVVGYLSLDKPQTPEGGLVGKETHGEWGEAGENKRGGNVPLLKKPFPFPLIKGKGIKGLGFTKNLSLGACL